MSSPARPDRAFAASADAVGTGTEPAAAAKRVLRRAVHARRRDRLATDPAAGAAAGRSVRDLLLATPEVAALGPRATVAAYLELPSEVPAGLLRAALLGRGIRVVVPVVLPDGDLDWTPVGELAAAPDTPPAEPELLGPDTITHASVVVLPGVAADRTGRRLGRGGGSYDRALARLDGLPAGRRPWTCVVVFADEVLPEVPVDPHDVAVDAVVTPAGLLRTALGRGAD